MSLEIPHSAQPHISLHAQHAKNSELQIDPTPPEEQCVDKTRLAIAQKFDIAFAWWASWLWSQDRKLNFQISNYPKQQNWFFSSYNLSSQDLSIYKKTELILRKQGNDFFRNTSKDHSLSRNKLLLNTSSKEFCDFLQLKRSSSNRKKIIKNLCLYIVRNIGLLQSTINSVTRVWGLHQIYLCFPEDVQEFFQDHSIHFCNPWQLVPSSLQPGFWNKLYSFHPGKKNPGNIVRTCCHQTSTITEPTLDMRVIKQKHEELFNQMTQLRDRIFGVQHSMRHVESCNDLDWMRSVLLPQKNEEMQSDIAFAWWFSWLDTDRRRTKLQDERCPLHSGLRKQYTTLYESKIDNLCRNRLNNILFSHQSKYCCAQTQSFNPLKGSVPISILADLYKNLRITPENSWDMSQKLWLYVAFDMPNKYNLKTRAWGLHQLYHMNPQAILSLFHACQIPFLDVERFAWEIRRVSTKKELSQNDLLQPMFWTILQKLWEDPQVYLGPLNTVNSANTKASEFCGTSNSEYEIAAQIAPQIAPSTDVQHISWPLEPIIPNPISSQQKKRPLLASNAERQVQEKKAKTEDRPSSRNQEEMLEFPFEAAEIDTQSFIPDGFMNFFSSEEFS